MKAALAAAVLLGACASLPPSGCTALSASTRYCLQPLPAGHTLAVNQLVDMQFPGRPAGERLVFAIDATDARMQIVGLSPLGQTVFRLGVDHGDTQWDGPPAAEALARRLPALVQLMLWPADSVRQGLDRDAALRVTPDGRRLHDRDGTLLLDTRQSDPDPRLGQVDAVFTPLDARWRVTRLAD